MEIVKYPSKDRWKELIQRPHLDTSALFDSTGKILEDIRVNGDKAVKEYSLRFDKVGLDTLEVSEQEWQEADKLVDNALKEALQVARKNIATFHASQQMKSSWVETMPGVNCMQKAVPIEKVGLYVPGGSAPLFSTVLMLAVPASIAGCKDIVLCTPPNKEGKVHPAVIVAAKLAGVKKIFKIGGIQAIAAMAYGTETVPKVYKIFGPGNQYVTAAKQLIALEGVAIDVPAGPSEAALIADSSANPVFIASDFLSQAEHGADSQSILATDDETLVENVMKSLQEQLSVLPREEITQKALQHSKIVLFKTMEEVIDFVNFYAPEHLIIQCKEEMQVAEKIMNAGSVFIGRYTPVSAGDYASGTNHTLPTSGLATAYSGVNLDSFVKKITFQHLTAEGMKNLGPVVAVMAENEGLDAHKRSVTLRLESL
ncbi:MAG: histidinol dehydrogenase [Bacteroidales bacterium]|nr:histidinol dehydrogenase [Bacteroidales bacterium]